MAYKDIAKKTAYQNEYIKKSYDRINLTVPKGKKEIIQAEAKKNNESLNAYITRAIDLLIGMGGSYGNSEPEADKYGGSQSISHTALSESQQKEITAFLQDGQTIEDYIRVAVLDKLKADTDKANPEIE